MITRRNFLKSSALASAGVGMGFQLPQAMNSPAEELFKISLAEWSVNRSLFKKKLDHLDFPMMARKHGIEAVEYVNQFFMDKAKDQAYLKEMKTRAEGEGVVSVLIMCDREGMLGAAEEKERIETVDKHKKWAEAAKYLGCHSIRVNGYSSVKWADTEEAFSESQKLVADGLRKLCEYADPLGINVLIENHGGFSSNGKWLTGVMDLADHPRAGTLPDFGNFRIQGFGQGKTTSYDAYQGVTELMPYAKGVSVKITAWDHHGNQSDLEYEKMMRIVLDAGYRGYCGIEHGEKDREWESIGEVKNKLVQVREQLAGDYK